MGRQLNLAVKEASRGAAELGALGRADGVGRAADRRERADAVLVAR